MSFDADEKLEMLTYLLNGGQFGQENGHGQQRNEQASIAAAQHPTQSTRPRHGLPVIETRADPGREQRKGVPEIVFGESKDVAQIIAMVQGLLTGSGRVIVSRIRPEMIGPLQTAFQGYTLRVAEVAHSLVIYRPEYVRPSAGGHVGVTSA